MKSVTDAFLDHLDRAREALRNPQTHAAFPCIKGTEDNPRYLCGECGYEVDFDDPLNEDEKSWIRLKDEDFGRNYLHRSCWALCPEAFADALHECEVSVPEPDAPAESDCSAPPLCASS